MNPPGEGPMDRDEQLERVRDSLDAWQVETLQPTLKRAPEPKREFQTSSDIEVKRLYTPLDLSDNDYSDRLGFPGSYPFTRGVQPTMYRGRLWAMRQDAGFGAAGGTQR